MPNSTEYAGIYLKLNSIAHRLHSKVNESIREYSKVAKKCVLFEFSSENNFSF